MSWHYSRALVAEFWEATCSDGKQSAQLKETLTPQAYLCKDRMTEFSRLSRYGMTFAPLTEPLGADLLMWFLADSRVRTYQLPGMVLASMANAPGYGEKWQESSVKYDLSSSSWKTAKDLFQKDLQWSSVILPKSGIALGGCLYQQENWERLTSDLDYGLLPTPSGVNGSRNHTMGRLDEWGGRGNPLRGTEIGQSALREFRRVDDGLSYRVDRVDTIRNAQVPVVAAAAFSMMASHHQERYHQPHSNTGE